MNPLEIRDTLNLIVDHITNPQDLLINSSTLHLLRNHPDIIFIRSHKKSDIPKYGLPKFLSIYTGSDTLDIAIEYGNVAIVKHLTSTITDPNWIWIVGKNGHLELVKYLISIRTHNMSSADYTANNNHALILAIKNNYTEVVNYLKSLYELI